MLPPLAVVLYDAVEEGLQEARAAWSSRAGPRSTHCGDERQGLVLSASTAVSSLHGRVKRRTAALALPIVSPLQGEIACVSPGTAWGRRLGHCARQRWRYQGIG